MVNDQLIRVGSRPLRPDVGKVRLQVNDRSSQLADVICELAKDSG
jgi:hypothetical protein